MDDFKNGLCHRINERINARGVCVVHDHELSRICAPEAALRQKQIRVIEKLAAKNGLDVSILEVGISATFKKRAAPAQAKLANGKPARQKISSMRAVKA